MSTFKTAVEGPSFHILVLELQGTGYISVPDAARSGGIHLAMPGDHFSDQFLSWDPEAQQGTTAPCPAEVVRATLSYTRGTILRDSSLHIFPLVIRLVTINSLVHYNDTMELQGGLVLFKGQDRIVLPYWQDRKDCVGNFEAAFSALHPPVAVWSGTDEVFTA